MLQHYSPGINSVKFIGKYQTEEVIVFPSFSAIQKAFPQFLRYLTGFKYINLAQISFIPSIILHSSHTYLYVHLYFHYGY